MKTNKDMYTVKFNGMEGSECLFNGECEMLGHSRMRINILEFNKVDLSAFMEWSRFYSESITGRVPSNLLKDVYLTNKDNKQTILYNCTLDLVDFGEFYIDSVEKITFEINYQWMNGEIIHYIAPIKLNIEIDGLTGEQADNVKKLFKEWDEIIKLDTVRWTSFLVEKDFRPKIKISDN